jgi:hypothetical protein
MIKLKQYLAIFLLCNLLFASFATSVDYAQAADIKTIIVTFATPPTPGSVSVTKAHLKYNKDFAWSYSFDDGIVRGYDVAFKYMNGGYSSYLGQYFGGLYFTDGAGNNVPFRGGYAFYTRNANYSDIHVNTPSYITWTQLQDAVDNGWNVFNHGYISATVGDPEEVYYIGDPGGHATGTLDYDYELTQSNVDVASHITLRNDSGATTTPFTMSQVILPNGDDNYIQPAFDNNFNAVYAQNNVFPFDNSTINAPKFTDVTSTISSDRHVMPRWFDYEYRYLAGGEFPNGLFNHVDELASLSSGSSKYWSQAFTHQITTSTYYPDWNGGTTWNSWKSLMDHVENTYGRFGADNIWVAGAEEVYNYMMVKQASVISHELVGNQLTITIDVTNVPANLKNHALSLLVEADSAISSIDYGVDFTHHTDNKTTGLINLDWGINSYSKNDITRVNALVSAAEVSKRKSDIDVARAYVNLLTTNPASIKTAYSDRLDAIVVPLRTWYVNVNGVDSLCGNATTTKAYPSANHPSYNWNYFTVGNTSAVACGDLLNLRDSDNQISTLALANTAPFKNGSLQSVSTGSNSAIYPDTVIMDKAQIYSSVTTPAKVKIYGLEAIKTYNVKLYGYTSASGATGNNTMTNYTIASTTKELIVKANLSNTVEFTNIVPVSGEIEITIAPKVAAWGYGMLNAIEIKENILAAPSSLSYTSPNTFTKNSTITPLSPTVTGLGITYSVSPSLPAGLSLNTDTGVISGAPTIASSLTTYTVTATNNGGSTSFGVAIAVNNIVPSSLSYTSPNTYIKNSTITPLSPTVTGEELTYSVSPSLPVGLSLNTDTGVISGTPTATSSLATYTVTATNNGGSTSFDIAIAVNNIAPSSLSYTSPNIYTENIAITSLSPTVTGEELTYSISPSLPMGLAISTSTGIISGTPTATSSATVYTVTASNTGGNTTFDLTITVNEQIRYSLSYSAESGGTLNGDSAQSVVSGANGSAVIAVSNSGYHFVKWSDDLLTPSRTDINITNNLSVVAQFAVDVASSNSAPISLPAATGSGVFDVSIPMNTAQIISPLSAGGVNILAYMNSQANFMAPESSNNWMPGNHSLKISDLNLSSNIITIDISSEPQTMILQKGESKEADIDGDKKNDIVITFVDVFVNRAEITVKSLQGNIGNTSSAVDKIDVMNEESLLSIKINSRLAKRLAGYILLQVEKLGQAWYLDSVSLSRYYLADGPTAYEALRKFGLGITNADLNKIPVAPDSALPSNFVQSKTLYSDSLVKRLQGRILLQVENRGEAWYINPRNGYRYYLADGEAAYQIMRTLSLGIINDSLRQIPVGNIE